MEKITLLNCFKCWDIDKIRSLTVKSVLILTR